MTTAEFWKVGDRIELVKMGPGTDWVRPGAQGVVTAVIADTIWVNWDHTETDEPTALLIDADDFRLVGDPPLPKVTITLSTGGNYTLKCECSYRVEIAGDEGFAIKEAAAHRHMHDMARESQKNDPFDGLPGVW